MSVQAADRPVRRLAALSHDGVVRNAVLGFVLTGLMAGAGAAFWIIAARLRPATDVGLAGSMANAAEALAVLSLLGYNVALIKTMPYSESRAADVLAALRTVSLVALVLGLGYALLLPVTSPRLADVVSRPWALLFAFWVAATAVNQLTDAIFLAVDRVAANVWINGVAMGLVKCALPFVIVGGGAFALYSSVGTAAAAAAVVSIVVLLRGLPPGLRQRSSHALRDARRFAQAGYASETLYLVPQLTFPLIIVNALGAEAASRYFVAFQVVTLLNALVYVVGHSMFASASRQPERATATVRRGGQTIVLTCAAGVLALVLLAPYLLGVFGSGYAAQGTSVLRLLALGSFGVGVNYWTAMRLRIGSHLAAMVGVQLTTTSMMVVAALIAVTHGLAAVAVVWGLGQLAGGLLGLVALALVRRRSPSQ